VQSTKGNNTAVKHKSDNGMPFELILDDDSLQPLTVAGLRLERSILYTRFTDIGFETLVACQQEITYSSET
jgi:hypothetical protein